MWLQYYLRVLPAPSAPWTGVALVRLALTGLQQYLAEISNVPRYSWLNNGWLAWLGGFATSLGQPKSVLVPTRETVVQLVGKILDNLYWGCEAPPSLTPLPQTMGIAPRFLPLAGASGAIATQHWSPIPVNAPAIAAVVRATTGLDATLDQLNAVSGTVFSPRRPAEEYLSRVFALGAAPDSGKVFGDEAKLKWSGMRREQFRLVLNMKVVLKSPAGDDAEHDVTEHRTCRGAWAIRTVAMAWLYIKLADSLTLAGKTGERTDLARMLWATAEDAFRLTDQSDPAILQMFAQTFPNEYQLGVDECAFGAPLQTTPSDPLYGLTMAIGAPWVRWAKPDSPDPLVESQTQAGFLALLRFAVRNLVWRCHAPETNP